MRNLCNYWEISSVCPGLEKTSPHTLKFSHFELASQKDKRKALMQLIGIACPQKSMFYLNRPNNWEAQETSSSTPGSREVKNGCLQARRAKTWSGWANVAEAAHSLWGKKIQIIMVHLSHNHTERKLQHSSRIDKLLAENGWSADKFHNAVRAWKLCPADHEVLGSAPSSH